MLSFQCLTADAQRQKKNNKTAADTSKLAQAAIKLPVKPVNQIKPFIEVVPAGSRSMKSFLTIHQVGDRVLFEIPDSLLSTDILVVTRINKGPADYKIPTFNIGYSGDEIGRATINFERIPGDRIVMRSKTFKQFSKDTTANGLSRSLVNNDYQTIQSIFPIKALHVDGKNVLIDLTDFINGDNALFTFNEPIFRAGLGSVANDKSYIDNIKTFPGNIEIRSAKTYYAKPGMLGTPPPISFLFNNSFIQLPKIPMVPREADVRVGFFSNSYTDFDSNPVGVTNTSYIQRWRMEPKAEDREKYFRGELVEPKKPIVIYIDPATPIKWVPYLIQGINDWQAAFEKAGFKNAIIGKEVAANDTTFSLDDARHSAIVYKPSEVPNAMGPNVNDPRTGEILETHISWFHSVMTVLQNWYTVQAGAIDPRTHKPELDEKLMGELIRFVSSHEIGHTLGLQHNFGASSTVPVEKLRDKSWVEANGHTPSIMDYARFNYVAQPEDGIGEKGIFPRIGAYDKWAIEWGYRILSEAKNAKEEKEMLSKLVTDKLASGKQYFYGSQLNPATNDWPMSQFDPRSQSEDLGNDAMLASSYGLKNLKRIKPHLMEWYKVPGKNYRRAIEVYTELVTQYSRYMGHVLRNVGGLYQTPKTSDQPGAAEVVVPLAIQKRAMVFLQNELFTTPQWLKDKGLYSTGGVDFSLVVNTQNQVLASLMSVKRISALIAEESTYGPTGYTANAMLDDLRSGIFSELRANRVNIEMDRRNLQKSFVEGLNAMLSPKNPAVGNDNISIAKAQAGILEKELRSSLGRTASGITRAHMLDLIGRLHEALTGKKVG